MFLKYKAIIDSDRFSKWYDESKYMKLKKYFEKVDWSKITSNLEKLPYYAFNLEKHTEKALVKPVPDENLFAFVNEWLEFKAYTDKPTYFSSGKRGFSYLGRFSFKTILDLEEMGRILTIIARGYLFHDKN